MDTWTAFQINSEETAQALRNAKGVSDSILAAQMALEKTAAVLAQQESDEIARQRVQAVLALAKQAPDYLKAAKAEGRLVASGGNNAAENQRKLSKETIMKYAGIGIFAVLALFELIGGKWGFALLAIIGGLLIYIGQDKEKTIEGQTWRAEGEIAVDADILMRMLENQCRAIDLAVSDLTMIESDHTEHEVGDQEDALLDLMSALMEAKESGREDLALDSLSEAEQTMRQLGISALRYSPEHSSYFDVLPTRGNTRTVRPALVSGERLLRRGVAAVQMQASAVN